MPIKHKIKKGRRGLVITLKETPIAVLITLVVLVVALTATLLLFFFSPYWNAPNALQANRELLLTTDGHWSQFDDYDMSVWCPNELQEETLDGDLASTQKLFVTRDKGEFPEIAFGVIVTTDEEIAGRTFDMSADPTGVLDIATPLVNSAFGNMINGAYPSVSVDVEVSSNAAGLPVLTGKGEAVVTLVLQDPKDPENPYSEETTTNIYYAVTTFYNRPVIVWSTWDYSTYEGEKRSVDAVTDAINSLMRSEDGEIIDGAQDTWNTQAPVTNFATQEVPAEETETTTTEN